MLLPLPMSAQQARQPTRMIVLRHHSSGAWELAGRAWNHSETSRAPMNTHTFCATVVGTLFIPSRLPQTNLHSSRGHVELWERVRSLPSGMTGFYASLDTSKSLLETLLLFEKLYIKSGS